MSAIGPLPMEEEQGPPAGFLEGLMGAGAAPPGEPPPEEEPPMPDDTEAAGDPSSVIREMQDLARAYMDVEDDEEDRLEMEKVTTSLQKLLAKQQKDMEAATGTTQGARFLRRNGPY